MAIEIVDLPIHSMVIFQFAMLNYQMVSGLSNKPYGYGSIPIDTFLVE